MRSRRPGDQRIPKRSPHEQDLNLCSACASSDMHPPKMVPCLCGTHLISDKASEQLQIAVQGCELKCFVIKCNTWMTIWCVIDNTVCGQ